MIEIGPNTQSATSPPTRIEELEREVAELREALEKCRKAFTTDARQKLVVGDETIYQLDGNTVYHALNAAREALAKSQSAQGTV